MEVKFCAYFSYLMPSPILFLVRCRVLTAASMKIIIVFRDIALCSLVEIDGRFRGSVSITSARPDD
jgi:hypothetical protein